MSAENKQLVEGAYAGMTNGDVQAFLSVLDPEIVVREPRSLPHGGEYRGMKELMGMFQKAGPLLDTSRLVVDAVTAEEDRVVAVIRVPLRSGGEALISEHWRFKDGKAINLDAFWADPTIVD